MAASRSRYPIRAYNKVRMLSLTQVSLVSQLSEHLYEYLPGTSAWNAYTFESAAKGAGVAAFWQGGSKLPAITTLLECTLDQRQASFVRLVELVVIEGVKYRRRKGNAVTREDIHFVNGRLRELDFPYSKLSHESFLASLPTSRAHSSDPTPERSHETNVEPTREGPTLVLERLRRDFLELQTMSDRQRAGIAFERLLGEVFTLNGLSPTAAFRVVGEQIDGAFVLDGDDYLLEAKWRAEKTAEADLLVFRGKVEGKSTFTRGLFVAVNGFTKEAVEAIVTGKQPNFVMLDGAHLFRVFDGSVPFNDLLRTLVRKLAQQGRPYVPVSEL